MKTYPMTAKLIVLCSVLGNHAACNMAAAADANVETSLVARITASDATNGVFGVLVSLSGDTAAIAAQNINSNAGAVYIFERNAGGPNHWGQVKKLTAPDATPSSYFILPTLDGDTLVVGAGGVSKAYVFERNAGGVENWGLVKELRPNWGGDGGGFGFSALNRDTLVVGASLSPSGAGAAFVFERNAGGPENWGLVKMLTASDGRPGDYFFTPAVDGDTIVIGAQGKNSHQGAVYIFERNAGGPENWGQVKEFTGSDSGTNDGFGVTISLKKDTLAVGSPNEAFYSTYSGAVYIFDRNAGGEENWGEVAKLKAIDASQGGGFGEGVSLSGDTLAVGAPEQPPGGQVYLFSRNAGGLEKWGQIAKVSPIPSPGDFGFGLALEGGTLLAASWTENGFAGAAYVFAIQNNHPPVADAGATIASAISPNGLTAVVALDGLRSYDPDGDALTYSWYEAGETLPLASGAVAQALLSVGLHNITLVVSDGVATSADNVAVEVITTAQATQRLITFVAGGQVRWQPLSASLDAALASINRGNVAAALGQLRSFENKLRAQVMGPDGALAEAAMQQADAIIAALGSSR